jgi:hypothetical protein
MIAALYVERGGVYWDLPGVDPWDEARDARTYAGPYPVVAHPPCARWHQLSAVNHARWGWAINEDGGCFRSALNAVTRYGGVLEHPAQSRAFEFYSLPTPCPGSWQKVLLFDSVGDLWVTEACQSAYGHRAKKKTWLAYSGFERPPSLDWRDVPGTHQIGFFDRVKAVLPRAECAATPIPFRDLLLSIARTAQREMVFA